MGIGQWEFDWLIGRMTMLTVTRGKCVDFEYGLQTATNRGWSKSTKTSSANMRFRRRGPRRRTLVASNSCRYIQPDEQPLRRSYLMVGRLTRYVDAIKIVGLQFDSSDSNHSKICIVYHILTYSLSSIRPYNYPDFRFSTALAQHHRRDSIANAWSGWVIVVLRHA